MIGKMSGIYGFFREASIHHADASTRGGIEELFRFIRVLKQTGDDD